MLAHNPLIPGPVALFERRNRASGKAKWTRTRVDVVFGLNSQLRAIAERYAWHKVMNNDRYDLAQA